MFERVHWRQALWIVRLKSWSLAALLWMVLAGAAAGMAFWATTTWLLDSTGDVLARDAKSTGADWAKVRIEAVRTGLAARVGAGAAVTLMLAFRRQAHQEYDGVPRSTVYGHLSRETMVPRQPRRNLARHRAPMRA